MQKDTRILLYVACDILFINFALVISVALWYRGFIPGAHLEVLSVTPEAWQWLLWMGIAATIINVVVLACFRLYNNLWTYAGIDELLKIFLATALTVLILYGLDVLIFHRIEVIARFVFVMAWVILLVLTTMSRLGERMLRRFAVTIGFMLSSKKGYKRVMIVGAGYAGFELLRNMLHASVRNRVPVLIVDDDPAKHNAHIMGTRIVNGIDNIPYLVEAYEITEITIAMPEADNAELRRILEFCTQTNCRLTIVPPISEVAGVDQGLREVSIGDLLHRDEIRLDTKNIRAYIEGACILITGGGGSIGSELCRQIIQYDPRRIVIIDIYENNAFDLMQELSEKYDPNIVVFRVASIRDKARMEEIFAEFKPDVVFHAAAHKHVILMEDSPAEAIKNNVFGTLNVIRAAIANDCGRFVLISSDKAVRPTNIYGATKRVTELVMQREAANKKGRTQLSSVRFGNVLGSRGSIVPKFKRQIAQGGPVTVYSTEVERFFMTISEACQLVLQAGGLVDDKNNGHVFILDMGKPVNIDDLARKLIRLSGYRPDEDIKIIYTGLLPGEKMTEELVLPGEKTSLQLTHHDKIWVAPPVAMDYAAFDAHIDRLFTFAQGNPERIGEALQMMDLHYEPTEINS